MTTITDPKVGVTYRTVLLKAADITRQLGHSPHGDGCVWKLINDALVALGVWADAGIRAEIARVILRVINGECPITWNYRQDAASVIDMLERAALSKGKSA